MTVLGLRFCARAFSSCGKRGPLFIAVRGPLTVAASLVAEHRLQTRRLSNRGSRAQLLRGMWDLPRPGHEPVSPALAGRFSTTAPPGKPPSLLFNDLSLSTLLCLPPEAWDGGCLAWVPGAAQKMLLGLVLCPHDTDWLCAAWDLVNHLVAGRRCAFFSCRMLLSLWKVEFIIHI